jgi:hypothetical protein
MAEIRIFILRTFVYMKNLPDSSRNPATAGIKSAPAPCSLK